MLHISVLQPPQHYISSLQKVFIDFVWQCRHWVKSGILYLRKSQGGLGLVHRLHAFRLRFSHEYLYYDRHSCFRFSSLKREITATYLPQHWNDVLHTSSRWETDAVIKHVTDIEISREKSKLVSLRNPPKKGLY